MKIVLTPDWFLANDVLIELFSFLILFVFFVLSMRSYRLSKNKNSLWLGIGFFLIAIAELATTFTKFVLFYDTTFTQNIGHMIVTYNVVKSVDVFYYAGFFFHKMLTLLGLYIIYRISSERKSFDDVLLIIYFLVISSFFGITIGYIFHLTALILLISIIINYSKICCQNKSKNTQILISAFVILTVSHVILMFSSSGNWYVFGQLIQLVSYLILLFLIIRILKHGKREKEKQGRHNLRHVGDDN